MIASVETYIYMCLRSPRTNRATISVISSSRLILSPHASCSQQLCLHSEISSSDLKPSGHPSELLLLLQPVELLKMVSAKLVGNVAPLDSNPSTIEAIGNRSNGNHASSKSNGKHQAPGHKSLLKSDALYQYILETSVYPREHEALRGLREMTATHPWNLMTTSPDEGQFLMLLLKLMNAKNTLELGVYTGYSLLSTALALPSDGKIIAMDINRKNFDLGYPFMEQAGVAHKIDFQEGPGLETLDKLLLEEQNHGFFDFIFVDADKDNYVNYHERLMELIKVGGIIAYDNTLWNGAVVATDDELLPKYVRFYKDSVCNINKVLACDSRIEISQVPVSDGITLCRRIL